ncbi:MAG TPA: PstS family phosphate ABC transporter substrate-binding protein [Longimicrobiales bacterium]|nr:PstS family phosphate ABC transporter substrate-binding protein [Longimicrobiales bacterium]
MRKHTSAVLTAVALVLAGCGGERAGTDGELSGSIEIDGSSTVYPVSQAVAEEFMAENRGGVRVTVGVSGTGGGFRRFCAGETEISNASRAIKDDERALCEQAGVDPLELQVAIDGLAVTVHPENTMVQCLTVDELRRIWEPGSTLRQWSEVREGLPAQPLRLYGPGTNSGTFDYFTEAIMGEEDASRPDYSASEDDNVLVQGVGGDVNALGYFGYAYYIENQDKLRAIGVDNGNGCVEPTPETVTSGQYAPLSRPLFIYVDRNELARPEVAEFVRFYMETAAELVTEVGYVPMDAASYQANLSQIQPSGSE